MMSTRKTGTRASHTKLRIFGTVKIREHTR
jgi:hypothetical protein